MSVLDGVSEWDLAYSNLDFFSEFCFDEEFGNTWFHRGWYDAIQDGGLRRIMFVAPRNSAKTTCCAKRAPLWLLGRDRDVKILILSRTGAKARSNMRFIRVNIESNERVKRVFPGLRPSAPWGEEMLTVENSRMDGEASVIATGLGGTITGFRADILIVDDLVDKTNVATENQRSKVIEFWNEMVFPTLNPNGRIFIICTRWHNKDFYSRLMEQDAYKGNIHVMSAFEQDERGRLVLDENELPISYWPERWPAEKLLSVKEEIGSLAFNCQYLNDPSGYEGLLFNPDHLTFYNPDTAIPAHLGDLDFYMALDPNIKEDPKSDNTAIITGAIDRKLRDVYILDMWAQPLGFVNQVKKLKEYGSRRWLPYVPKEVTIRKIGIESVAYQRALQQSGYTMGLPVVEVQHTKTDKITRILRNQPHFENGRIKFPDPETHPTNWWDDFYEEYVTFPRGRRDDRMDGLDILIEIMGLVSSGSSIPFGPGKRRVPSFSDGRPRRSIVMRMPL